MILFKDIKSPPVNFIDEDLIFKSITLFQTGNNILLKIVPYDLFHSLSLIDQIKYLNKIEQQG